MASNTNIGPSGENKSSHGVTKHETYSVDRKGRGSVTGNGTGPEGSKGLPAKTGSPVNGSGK